MLLTRTEMGNVGIKPNVATKSLEEVKVRSIEVTNTQYCRSRHIKASFDKAD